MGAQPRSASSGPALSATKGQACAPTVASAMKAAHRRGVASQCPSASGACEALMGTCKRASGVGRRPGSRLGVAAALILIGMMCQAPFAWSPWAEAAGTRRIDLIHRQRELQYQAAIARERLRRLKPKQRAAGYELRAANSRLRRVRNQLAHANAQLDSTRDELHDVTLDLQTTQARLGSHREAMSSRLAALYELGGVEYLEVLARAASFADFANRLYLVQLVVDQDLGLLRAIEREQQRVAAYQQRVQAKEREVSLLEARIERKHDEYASIRQEKAQVWSSLRRQRIYWERGLAQMEQESRDIGVQIRRYQRTEGRIRWATPWRGSFMRPVYGAVTSGFGYRIHPILKVRKMHTGIDISAATGTRIHAADTGTVIWSARRGNYGLCVVIDHGGGMSTVYGHCSRLGCRVGQEVSKGEVIGYVGSTGLSTGPHLHFEVRRNGSPVNPFSF